MCSRSANPLDLRKPAEHHIATQCSRQLKAQDIHDLAIYHVEIGSLHAQSSPAVTNQRTTLRCAKPMFMMLQYASPCFTPFSSSAPEPTHARACLLSLDRPSIASAGP